MLALELERDRGWEANSPGSLLLFVCLAIVEEE
jgi:hypothetical protein